MVAVAVSRRLHDYLGIRGGVHKFYYLIIYTQDIYM